MNPHRHPPKPTARHDDSNHRRDASLPRTRTQRLASTGSPVTTGRYDEAMSGPQPRSYDKGELNAAVRDLPPATADDVSITWDGRRLDTVDKVLAFVAEIEAERVAEADLSDDERAQRAAARDAQRIAHGFDRR